VWAKAAVNPALVVVGASVIDAVVCDQGGQHRVGLIGNELNKQKFNY
jgi:hypothetical protein